MKQRRKASEIAALYLSIAFDAYHNRRAPYNLYGIGDGLEKAAVTKFTRLTPGKGTLWILAFVKHNPGTTRLTVKDAYRAETFHEISNNLFQNLLWAELITPRKYTITDLGRRLLKQYNVK